jgi:O-antigen/teichoic acid export membrane protein
VQLSLGRNVVASVGTAALWIGSALITVPLVLDAVGTEGFGVWTIALAVILFVGVAEAGLGAGIMRFVAVAHGAGARDQVARVAWTSLALYVAAGAALVGVAQLGAPLLVDLFDVPGDLRADAETMWRIVACILFFALVTNGLGSVQQGLERFGGFALSTAIGLAVQVVALVLLLPAAGLPGVALAALMQQAVIAAVRAWSIRDVLTGGRPSFLTRAHASELVGFSARMQLSAVATFANGQSDKVVLGLIGPAATVGQLGIGSQVAEAGRLVGGAAINPMVSRMATVHGGGDVSAMQALYARLDRLWVLTVLGATTISLAALQPLIQSWLGSGHDEAALLGGFLVVAFGINLLPGVPAAYLRAAGLPGFEARYALAVVLLNLPFSVVLGLLAGGRGVVAGTACAYAVGTVWFFVRTNHITPARPAILLERPLRVALALALAAAGALGWGLAMNELLPSGVALLPVAAGVGVALIAYLSITTGVRPTPANARQLLA